MTGLLGLRVGVEEKDCGRCLLKAARDFVPDRCRRGQHPCIRGERSSSTPSPAKTMEGSQPRNRERGSVEGKVPKELDYIPGAGQFFPNWPHRILKGPRT